LALRRVRVRAALEALALNRLPALVPVRAAPPPRRWGPDADDRRRAESLPAAAVLVERDPARNCDVQRLRLLRQWDRRCLVAGGGHIVGEARRTGPTGVRVPGDRR